MSMTANQMLTQAMRWLGILEGEEAMSAAELADGLVTLNGVLHGFNTQGIAYVHVDLAATDTVNVPDEQVRNTMLLVAEALAPEYEIELSPQRQGQVIDARNALQAAYAVVPQGIVDITLTNRTAGSFDIRRL